MEDNNEYTYYTVPIDESNSNIVNFDTNSKLMVTPKVYRGMYITVIVGLIILIITIIIVTVLRSTRVSSTDHATFNQYPKVNSMYSSDDVHKPHGKASHSMAIINNNGKNFNINNCLSTGNKWDYEYNMCICKPHYYGPTCDTELYDDKYTAVGYIDPTKLDNIIKTTTATQKSFINTSCSYYCDTIPSCSSFTYNENTKLCTLLKGTTKFNNISDISPTIGGDANFYTIDLDTIQFKNTVFLSYQTWSHDKKYWMSQYENRFKHVNINTIEQLQFYPKVTLPKTIPYTGIYSTERFTEQDVSTLMKMGNTMYTYIHKIGAPLYLPNDWINKFPIYVYYF